MNKITETYDKKIYSERAVKAAIKMYASICRINLEEKNAIVTCTFYGNKPELEQIKNEFGNFLIEIMQQRTVL